MAMMPPADAGAMMPPAEGMMPPAMPQMGGQPGQPEQAPPQVSPLEEPVQIETPATAPPEQPSYAIPIGPEDQKELANLYGDSLTDALARRDQGARTHRWIANAVPATSVTLTPDPQSPTQVTKGLAADIQEWWERYELVPPNRELPFEGAANYRVPLTKWAVDSIHARMMAGLTTIRPYFRIEALEPTDMARSSRVEDFLDYSAEHELFFVEWLDDALLNAEVEGTAIGFLTWEDRQEHVFVEEIEERQEAVKDPDTGQVITDGLGQPVSRVVRESKIVERDIVTYRGPRLELIPLLDFVVGDRTRKDLRDQPWMGHRTRLYRTELQQLKGGEGYFDEAIESLLSGGGNQKTEGGTQTANPTPRMKMLDQFEVWSILGWYDWDQDDEPERVVMEIVMPQKVLIRLIKFPYLHNRPNYMALRLLPRSQDFYGRSLVADLLMTQDEIDAMHNQRTDATSIAIASLFMFLYDEQAGFDPERNEIRLGKSIALQGDITHIKSLAEAFRGIQVPGMDIENMLLGFAERLSGISDPQAGRPAEGRKTAFEIGAVIQEGNVRFRRMIERIELALAEIAYQTIALYQQFGNRAEPKIYRVLNDPENPFRTVEVGEMAGRWNYRVHGVAIASNRDIDAKKALDVLKMVESSPIFQKLIMADPRRLYKLAQTVLDKVGWPVEDLIGKEENMPGAQVAAAQAAVQQGGGQAVPTDVNKMVEDIVQKTVGGMGIPRIPLTAAESPGGQAIENI